MTACQYQVASIYATPHAHDGNSQGVFDNMGPSVGPPIPLYPDTVAQNLDKIAT